MNPRKQFSNFKPRPPLDVNSYMCNLNGSSKPMYKKFEPISTKREGIQNFSTSQDFPTNQGIQKKSSAKYQFSGLPYSYSGQKKHDSSYMSSPSSSSYKPMMPSTDNSANSNNNNYVKYNYRYNSIQDHQHQPVKNDISMYNTGNRYSNSSSKNNYSNANSSMSNNNNNMNNQQCLTQPQGGQQHKTNTSTKTNSNSNTNTSTNNMNSYMNSNNYASSTPTGNQRNMICSLRSEIFNLKNEVTKLIEREPQNTPMQASTSRTKIGSVQEYPHGTQKSYQQKQQLPESSSGTMESKLVNSQVNFISPLDISDSDIHTFSRISSQLQYNKPDVNSSHNNSLNRSLHHNNYQKYDHNQQPHGWDSNGNNPYKTAFISEEFKKRMGSSNTKNDILGIKRDINAPSKQDIGTPHELKIQAKECTQCSKYKEMISDLKLKLINIQSQAKEQLPDNYSQHLQHQQKVYEQKLNLLERKLTEDAQTRKEAERKFQEQRKKSSDLKQKLLASQQSLQESNRVIEQVRLSITLKNELLDKLETQLRQSSSNSEKLQKSLDQKMQEFQKMSNSKRQFSKLNQKIELLETQERRWMKDVEYWKNQYQLTESSLNQSLLKVKHSEGSFQKINRQLTSTKQQLASVLAKFQIFKKSQAKQSHDIQSNRNCELVNLKAAYDTLFQQKTTIAQKAEKHKEYIHNLQQKLQQSNKTIKQHNNISSKHKQLDGPCKRKHRKSINNEHMSEPEKSTMCEHQAACQQKDRLIQELYKDLAHFEHDLKINFEIRSHLSDYADALNEKLLQNQMQKLNERYQILSKLN